MKRNPSFILRVFLLAGDLMAIVGSFGLAYLYRTQFDPRPYLLGADTSEFIITIAYLLPIWVIVLFISGVYDKAIYPYRPKVYWRLLVASAIGTMSIITFSFFVEAQIFPARLIAIYSFGLCFVFFVIEREFIHFVHRFVLRRGVGVLNAVIIGNNPNTSLITEYFRGNPESGYRVVAVVANDSFVPDFAKTLKYPSLKAALTAKSADVVIQTDEVRTDKVYFDTVDHHLSYMFIPNQEILLSHMGEMHIMGAQPVVSVRTTPLMGWSQVTKRISDIVMGFILLVLALPFMLIIAVIVKLSEPRAKIIYKTDRLSRFGRKVKIFKFRSLKTAYNNMSPEEAFAKMGKPELAKAYRDGGDQLENDPRVSRFGRFLRTTSLDELPQLFNVLKGDISLVGPRALVPEELGQYYNKNLILSVKSGLTGLAQVSGRRNISFEERRSLDTYYIQNWSLALDIQIILKTILSVILRRGAR